MDSVHDGAEVQLYAAEHGVSYRMAALVCGLAAGPSTTPPPRTVAGFTPPWGVAVDQGRLALHAQIQRHAVDHGVTYREAVLSCAAETFRAPQGCGVDQDQLALHGEVQRRAAVNGVTYREAVLSCAAETFRAPQGCGVDQDQLALHGEVQRRAAVNGVTYREAVLSCAAETFRAPQGCGVDQDQLALHAQIQRHAVDHGVTYREAVLSCAAETFRAPQGCGVDQDQLALHGEVQRRAAVNGVTYREAVLSCASDGAMAALHREADGKLVQVASLSLNALSEAELDGAADIVRVVIPAPGMGGELPTADGRVQRVPDPAVLAASINAQRTGVRVDFDHQSEPLSKTFRGSTAAEGWARDFRATATGAIEAVLDLSRSAREALRAGRYRYLSPAVLQVDGEVTRMSSLALVNNPNMDLEL